jgi:hypothetical protein
MIERRVMERVIGCLLNLSHQGRSRKSDVRASTCPSQRLETRHASIRTDKLILAALHRLHADSGADMEQKFEGTPRAEVRLDGRRVIRSAVTSDWGSLLRWRVSRDGQLVTTANARAAEDFEPPVTEPGTYEIVLEMWKYVDYKKKPTGEFINSEFVPISAPVTYTV